MDEILEIEINIKFPKPKLKHYTLAK